MLTHDDPTSFTIRHPLGTTDLGLQRTPAPQHKPPSRAGGSGGLAGADATIPLATLAEPGAGPARTQAMLDWISRRQDGRPTAANTANRKRMVINDAMAHAVEVSS